MLVLSRKIGEEILIGEDVVITLLGIQGRRAKIGITAPLEVKIMRPKPKGGLDSPEAVLAAVDYLKASDARLPCRCGRPYHVGSYIGGLYSKDCKGYTPIGGEASQES